MTEALLVQVRDRLAHSGQVPDEAAVARAAQGLGVVLGPDAVLDLTRRLRDELIGTGPLAPLLADRSVTDVVVNGPGQVLVDRGCGLEPCPITFTDAEHVRRLAVRLAAAAGRRLDDAMPWADATLPDGTRLHAVLPPIAPDGPLLSLRVLGRHVRGLDELLDTGTIPATVLPVVRAIVECRLSFLVTGGTGVGKTTVLSALLSLVPEHERIVMVEDTRELHPDHPHAVRLLARAANVEGAGAVGLDDLVRQALRMRPDRLVVGEVRGREVVDLLAALNTGHDGGCGTVHANRSSDLPARLEALGVAAGLDRLAVHSMAGAGLHVVLHLIRHAGRRRLAEIGVVSARQGLLAVEPALRCRPDGRVESTPASERLETLLQGVG